MTDLSLGYDVAFQKDSSGMDIPRAHRINEVSICVKGARDRTQIKGRVDVSSGTVQPFSEIILKKQTSGDREVKHQTSLIDTVQQTLKLSEKIYRALHD